MGIVEFVALIMLFVLSILFMIIITICQFRLVGRMDELQSDRKMMREELTSVRERLKGIEVKKDIQK